MWEGLKKRGINEYLIEKIKETYGETKCKVKVGERMSEYFWTKRRVRQGCPLSPTLFNLYIADLAEKIGRGLGGMRIGRELIVSIEYADDVVLLAKKEESLRAMMKRLEKYIKKKKLQLNVEKSKVMVFRKGRGKK